MNKKSRLLVPGRGLIYQTRKTTAMFGGHDKSCPYKWLVLSLALVVGALRAMPLQKLVLALTETAHTFPTETAFNADGYDDNNGVVAVGGTVVSLAKNSTWWDLDWRYKIPVTVKNLGSTEVFASSTSQITVNLTTLGLGTTKLQSDLDDLRVVYSTGATHTEISRSVVQQVGATNVATISFPISATLSAGTTDTGYALYYGNTGATAPGTNGYSIGGKTATLVCPFNGTTTCVDGETPSTETGAIRYSRNGALSFDGYYDSSDHVTGPTLPSATEYTIEAWFKNNGQTFTYPRLYSGWGGFDSNDVNGHSTGTAILTNPGGSGDIAFAGVDNDGEWHHIALVYTGTEFKVYKDGVSAGSYERTFSVTSKGFTLMSRDVGQRGFAGELDEFRISNTVRYTENFTPSRVPFVTDDNTLVLYHFDENGDDPRNSGKAIDASGNARHGTIVGAKYVSGLVGVDASATDYGNVWPQSYASHNGIFIEEGTTNLVPNPSFEHSSYNTGWGLPYFNLGNGATSFTAAMSKRNSAGPFAAGPMVQTSDSLTVSKGSTVSGYFYENFDEYQGSIVLWVTPEWDGDDDADHTLIHDYQQGKVSLRKTAQNTLLFHIAGDAVSVGVSGWSSGSTYLVVGRWDKKNTLDGTNYMSLTVDELTSFSDSSLSATGIVGALGIASNMSSGNVLIEGLTFYRRPLWDGEYGIDVGNGDEIEQIYNAGAGKDPTLVTGSWDVVFALPTNASAGTLSTGTGEAWTHPHSSNVLGVGGFMMGAGYTGDGWAVSQPSDLVVYSDVGSTFTAAMSKRNSAGPFAGGPVVQGLENSSGVIDESDKVTMAVGSSISTDFYQNIDGNQGSVVFWITPEWNGDDGRQHVVLRPAIGGSAAMFIKDSGGNLKLFHGATQLVSVDVSEWEVGHTYMVTGRWDKKNKLDGTNYGSLTIGDSSVFGGTTQPSSSLSESVMYLSSDSLGRYPANALIEGLTIYRRPLWDGSYGINVGNGDEIEQIYNAGAGKDPTLVTGSWDVVFALPTNASSGSLGVGGTGQAWSHPHSSNVLGTGGFMMGAGYTGDGWRAIEGEAGGVSFDVGTSATGLGVTAVAWEHTVTSEDDRFLAVTVNYYNATSRSVTGVTYNGVPLTKLQSKSYSGVYSDLWYMVAPEVGTNSVVVTMSNSTNAIVAGAGSFYGVDQSSPVGVGVTASGNSASVAIDVGSSNGGVVLGTVMFYGGASVATLTPGVGQTTVYDASVEGSSWDTGVASYKTAGVGETSSFSYSISKSGLWSAVAVGINSAGGAGGEATVEALATGEKIFAGGYKVTSGAANQGIGYTLAGLTAGQNYVVRAVVHSDGTAVPKIQIWDDTNDAEITSFTGSAGTGRTAPDVLLFTFELPTTARYGSAADSTAMEVRLLNTQSSGTLYWHQVEVLQNLIDNPSLEVGSSATGTWIPDGWGNGELDVGDSEDEVELVYSGGHSIKFNTNAINESLLQGISSSLTAGKFFSAGGRLYGVSEGENGDITIAPHNYAVPQSGSGSLVATKNASWNHVKGAFRKTASNTTNWLITLSQSFVGSSRYADDLYVLTMKDVSLTVTPASQENSTETTGLRVDGADSLVRPVDELTTTSGTVRFTMTPRHNFDIGSSFGVANPVIMQAYLDGDNYIKVHKSDATTLQLVGRFNATQISVGWTNPTLDAGTSYGMEINYTSGGSMNLLVDGVNVGTTSGVVAFSAAPNLIYFGTDNGGGGSNPYDLTISSYEATAEVTALATAEKIYGGGYKWTNLTSNQGIGYTLSGLSAGQNYVVRAVAHSDGTAIPKVQIWDDTNNAEITSLTGSTGTGRTDPDILLFTFELPTTARYGSAADSTAMEVRLLNTQSSGTLYWHQVEVLQNLIDNPSMEVGSTASGTWIPTGWTDQNVTDDQTSRDSGTVHSGNYGMKWNSSAVGYMYVAPVQALGKYVDYGVWSYGDGSAGFYFGGRYASHWLVQYSSSAVSVSTPHDSSFKSTAGVFRNVGGVGTHLKIDGDSGGVGNRYIDDAYIIPLDDVKLTVTGASQANSAEATGLRVDGKDTLTQAISELDSSSGMMKFKVTPRHSWSVAGSFGTTAPVVFEANADADDFIRMQKVGGTLATIISMAGTTAVANWGSPTLDSGTSYPVVISYSVGGSMTVNIGGTDRASVNVAAGSAFGAVPDTAYFGSDSSGTNQYDATYTNFEAMTPSENTTAPYYKFGSKSLKIINSTNADQYTIDVGATNTNTLSAYVYNGSTVGGTVDATVAGLYFGNQAVGTTYADQGGGWWRLTGTVVGTGATVPAGVEVKAGKTVYVDGVQLEQKTYVTTYADGSLGTGYAWSGMENNSNSNRSVSDLKYSTSSNVEANQGAVSFWVNLKDVSSANASHKLVSMNGSEGGTGIGVWTQMTGFRYSYPGNAPWANVTAVEGDWYHVVITWDVDDNSIVYYSNGVATSTQDNFSVPTLGSDIGVGIQYTGTAHPGNAEISDLRIFNGKLSQQEVRDLYWQGLMVHSNGSEGVDRYNATGTYISPVVDLGIIGAWGSSAFQATESLAGGSLNYWTRSSSDNVSWSDWVGTVGTSIASDPRQYFQWKVDLSSNDDQSETPEITGMVVSYAEDSTAPTNPSDLATAYSASVGTTEISSDTWYNYTSPSFVWGSGVDTGEGASGVDGYHLLLTSDIGATPADNADDDCYAYVLEGSRTVQVGSGDLSGCELSNGTKYLLIQTEDVSGNVAGPVNLFIYKYDGSSPAAPSSVSSTTVGYTATNMFTFYWPSALDTGPAGIMGYEYKTGTTDPADAFYDWQYTADVQVTGVTAYKEGQNTFYVRSLDNAGNYSTTTSNIGVAMFYYNETAPTAPRNVSVSPETNAAGPAATNSFTVTWDKPESYSGEILKYHYCVNCTPGAGTMTETTAGETAERSLTAMALATQQGKNTFYIVAEDNNIDSVTGLGNRNFEAYASVDFYASTVAPASPTNLTISDASDRSSSKWRLTLAWDVGSSLVDPDHYEVYRSTDNTTFAVIGTVTGTAYTDASLTQSTTYYYKVKAVDDAGSESSFSNTVNDTPEGKYTSPPSAGGTPTVTAGSSTATIAWVTGRSAYGTVEYGKDSGYGSAASGTTAATSHSIKLTGLAPGTTYHYRVQSLDESGLVGYERSSAYSADYTFTTLATAEISDIVVEEVGLETAVISWKTTTVASTEIDYGKSETYGKNQTISTTAAANTHTARLTNLDHSTTYHFRIKGVTVDGTDIYSQDMIFETVTYPKITAYILKTDQNAGGTSIAVAWSTNVKTTSVVQYKSVLIETDRTTTELEGMSQAELAKIPITSNTDQWKEASKSTLELTHVLKISDLEDGSMYIVQFRGRDEFGNEVVSDPIRYVTGADTRAPVIGEVTVETQISGSGSAGTASVVISWETDEPATTQVVYSLGTEGDYNLESQKEEGLTKRHVVVLRDLETSSAYHLQIRSEDETGNEARSEDLIAVTPGAEESALDVVLMNLEEVFGFLKI